MVVIAFNDVKGPNGWLSNMSPDTVFLDGQVYPTAEHLFQCLRFPDFPGIQSEINEQPTPLKAKSVAKKYRKLHPSTKENDLQLMRKVIRLKAIQNPDLLRKLVFSDGEIIEDGTNRPSGTGTFWGASHDAEGKWVGENHLGRIWMELRDELKRVFML